MSQNYRGKLSERLERHTDKLQVLIDHFADVHTVHMNDLAQKEDERIDKLYEHQQVNIDKLI